MPLPPWSIARLSFQMAAKEAQAAQLPLKSCSKSILQILSMQANTAADEANNKE